MTRPDTTRGEPVRDLPDPPLKPLSYEDVAILEAAGHHETAAIARQLLERKPSLWRRLWKRFILRGYERP